MWKYIIAAVLIMLVWGLWYFLELPLLVPILASLAICLGLLGLALLSFYRARRAASNLEQALSDQAAQHANSARPDAQMELAEVKSEFEKAVSALKTSKLGSGTNALYALPWHIIIGPPGAGKTTALRNSGIHFPYLSARTGGAVRGIGGTRNCDWWFTNEAVILDTAGRWSTQDEDREEWAGFLDLLKRYRSRKPLNGIIVAVSLAELGEANEDQAATLAQKIRERVDEAMTRLQVSLPVYVVFTKCDLMPGFVETFGDLSKNERGQVWGFTVPVDAPTTAAEAFDLGFDELVAAVDARQLRRLQVERRLETRELVYIFPKQLAVLKDPMLAFVSQLFELNVFRETPRLRGVYFTSGTQEGRPIDRVMQRMAAAFGVAESMPQVAPVTEAKSYFIRDMFREVIFKDVDVAVLTEQEIRRRKRWRYGVAGGLFFLAMVMLGFPAYSWVQNSQVLEQTSAAVASTEPPGGSWDLEAPVSPATLDAVRQQLNLLAGHREDLPFSMTMGMYEGDRLWDPLRAHYVALLRKAVVAPLFDGLQRELSAFDREYQALATAEPSTEQHRRVYELLRNYLLLSAPRESSQPALEAALAQELATALTHFWVTAAGVPRAGAAATSMGQDIELYVAALAEDPSLALPRDSQMVDRVRSVLGRTSSMELAVERLIERFDGRGLDLTLDRLMGRPVPNIHANGKVRAVFTRRVWEEHVRSFMDGTAQGVTEEAWVMGLASSVSAQGEQRGRLTQVQSRYFSQYIDEWREFLRSVRVDPPTSNRDAHRFIQDLTRGQPTPFGRLLHQVHYNTSIKTVEEEEAERAAREKAAGGGAAAAAEKGLVGAIKRKAKGQAGRQLVDMGAKSLKNKGGGQVYSSGQVSTADVRRAFDGFTSFGVPQPLGGPGDGPALPPTVTALDSYVEQLLFIRNALQMYFDDPNHPAVLEEPITNARNTTRSLIDAQEVGWRPVFEVMLWPPIDAASLSSSQAIAMGAGRVWCSEVYEPYMRTIAGRYPFSRNGHDLGVADFAAFYQSGGVLWAFYDEVLANYLPRQGDRFQFDQQRLGRNFSAALPRFLMRSRDITNSFFPAGATEPRVDFDIRIRPSPRVATQVVNIGGKAVEYHNEPEQWQRMSWPGENPAAGALIEIRGGSGMRERVHQEGEWGLFHLLEAGSVTTGGGGRVFTVVWRLRTQDVDITIDFRPVRADSPFFGVRQRDRSPRLLQPVRVNDARVPRVIVGGQRPCGRN
jgi:type VI secretion system protein ImpL